MDKLTKAQQKLLDYIILNGPIHIVDGGYVMSKTGRTAHKRVVNNLVDKEALVSGNDALFDGAPPQTLVTA